MDRPVGVPSCLAPSRPAVSPCANPSRPARGMSGFWILQVDLHRNSFVRAWRETPRSIFFDGLEAWRGRWRSSTQSSAPKVEDGGVSSICGVKERRWGGVLRFSRPKIEDRRWEGVLRSSGSEGRRWEFYDLPTRKIVELPSSIFGAEYRRIFSL